MNDPTHPILDQPWRWEIDSFTWHSKQHFSPCALDVRFVRDGVYRTLRFIEPTDVTIQFSDGSPIQCGDLIILDIRGRQLAGLEVQVTEFGASSTPLRLYAKTVQAIEPEQQLTNKPMDRSGGSAAS